MTEKRAALVKTYPERILQIVKSWGKPVNTCTIEFLLKQQEFNKCLAINEEYWDFVDHFDVINTIRDLYTENKLLEYKFTQNVALPEWDLEGSWNPQSNDW